jgi:AcrR family transcriptional regulator
VRIAGGPDGAESVAFLDVAPFYFDNSVEIRKSPGMPKLVNADDQRQAIREAARRVFAQRGLRGTGLTHVAAAAGMGRSSLYHYYSDKKSLLADMVREMLDGERALFRAHLRREGPALERLEGLARDCVALFPEWAAMGRALHDLRLEDARSLRGFFRALRGDTASVIEEGQRAGTIASEHDPALLASIWIGAIDGLLLQFFIDPRAMTPEALAESLVSVTRRMLIP